MQLSFFKTCTRCQRTLFFTNFAKDKSKAGGIGSFCQSCNRERLSEYDRTKRQEQSQEYLEKKRELAKRKYQKNIEKERQRTKRYATSHRDTIANKWRKRRATELNAIGHFTDKEFRNLCQQHGNICLSCKQAKPLTADHVIPLSRGGTNDISNIQPLCMGCNLSKGTKTIDYRPAP